MKLDLVKIIDVDMGMLGTKPVQLELKVAIVNGEARLNTWFAYLVSKDKTLVPVKDLITKEFITSQMAIMLQDIKAIPDIKF